MPMIYSLEGVGIRVCEKEERKEGNNRTYNIVNIYTELVRVLFGDGSKIFSSM